MSNLPLFDLCPALEGLLAHVPLGEYPTPVEGLERLGEGLYVKRDDLSGKEYGGNKVRKLEFLLEEARCRGLGEVLTFGCAGSNHALATAIYARQLGLRSISMLMPQPNAESVRRNLLMSHAVGAELHMYRNMVSIAAGAQCQLVRHKMKTGRIPYIIPPGGSSPLGVAGFVNAGLELGQQAAEGQVPEPDFVYVATGTAGTMAGLVLGLKAAGLKTRTVGVRVTARRFMNEAKVLKLLRQTNNLLHALDASFPLYDFREDDFVLRHGFYGEAYGLYTPESVEAARRAYETGGLKLEGTYTGKALAALLHDEARGRLREKTAVFWNTYNSRNFAEAIADIDYRQLPTACHRYFEDDVQPLDKEG